MQTATCSLQFSLHFTLHLRVNINFVLNPIRRVARGAGGEIAELPDVFLHVASGGVACKRDSVGVSDKTRAAENAERGGEGSDCSRTLSVPAAVIAGGARRGVPAASAVVFRCIFRS